MTRELLDAIPANHLTVQNFAKAPSDRFRHKFGNITSHSRDLADQCGRDVAFFRTGRQKNGL